MRNPYSLPLQDRNGAAQIRTFAVGGSTIRLAREATTTQLHAGGILCRHERRLHDRRRSLIIVRAAETSGECGPETFDRPSLLWAFGRANVVALWGCAISDAAAAVAERLLSEADRAVLVLAEQGNEDAWQAHIEANALAARIVALRSDLALPPDVLRFGFIRPVRGCLH